MSENCEPVISNERQYRARLRAAILQSSSLLGANAADETIPGTLGALGTAFECDRVLVLENGPLLHSVQLCYGWQRPEVVQVTHAMFGEYPLHSVEVGESMAPLREGKHVWLRRGTASGAVLDFLTKIDTQSILCVPIVVEAKVWGCLGVDSCTKLRQWASFEIDLLRMMANFVGTAIVRDRYVGLLRASEQSFRTALEAAMDAMVVIDSAGCIQYWNPAAERMLGYCAAETLGRPVHQCLAPAQYQEAAAAGIRHFRQTGSGPVMGSLRECAVVRKDGTEIPVELSIAPMQIDGRWSAIGVVRDISTRKEADRRIRWLACHDGLTGLPNRGFFVGEIESALARYRRSGERFAVLYLDLDHFKDVNDTLGHSAGDTLLKQAAGRLRSTVRDSDVVARFGGDEFAILATNASRPEDVAVLAGKLVEEMSGSFLVAGTPVNCSASIGIAVCDEVNDAETLLAHADAAMYRSKAEERGCFRFFTPALHDVVSRRVGLLRDLGRALDRGEFRLCYQPQVDMPTGAITGVEALIRWQHPQRGLLSPIDFLSVAEDSGLCIQLGRFVLDEACRQTRRWLDDNISVPLMAVNVSPLQFKDVARFSADIQRTIEQAGLPPTGLELELTETALMRASRESSECIRRLREWGIQIAIDDFGTGYSSLNYLRLFPVSRLKIAQTFVGEITTNPGSAAITRVTIKLAAELGLRVIAEGVESREQASLLNQWGCHAAQGFYFSQPLEAVDITPLLRCGTMRCLDPQSVNDMPTVDTLSASAADMAGGGAFSSTPCPVARIEMSKCRSSLLPAY